LAHLVVGIAAVAVVQESIAEPLQLIDAIPMPSVVGRIDHLALDVSSHRLYVAARGNDSLEVLDLSSRGTVAHVTGLSEPQGVVVLPDTREVVVTNGGDGSVRFFDPQSFEVVGKVDLDGDADNVRYDRETALLYVGYGSGGIAMVDPTTRAIVGTIALSGHPESFALDPNSSRMFVNVADAKRISVVDRVRRVRTNYWDLAHGFDAFFAESRPSANFPLAFDAREQRLFVGLRRPPRLLVMDTRAETFIAQVTISGDTDDLWLDAERDLLYVICGEGFVDVIARRGTQTYSRVTSIPTTRGARTAVWDPDGRRLYVAAPRAGTEPAKVLVFAAP
jgi:DNA-binding beta-propeller fold protein YncE